jgi:hypothetical protein
MYTGTRHVVANRHFHFVAHALLSAMLGGGVVALPSAHNLSSTTGGAAAAPRIPRAPAAINLVEKIRQRTFIFLQI